MRSRKWISILALFGVLLHAGAVVRHNAAMTGANLQYQALVTGLAQICHGTATGDALAAAELPYVPKPTDAQNGCPICSGLSSAVALAAPPQPALVSLAPPVTIAFHPEAHCVPDSGYAVCPAGPRPTCSCLSASAECRGLTAALAYL